MKRSLPLRAVARALGVVAILGVALGVLAGRVVLEGREHLVLSDRAFDEGDLRTSVLHARRAAAAYLPGAPHVDAAFERLRAIAIGSEAKGDRKVAALAWRAIRGASLEARHVSLVRTNDLAIANASLARLASVETRPPDPEVLTRAEEALRRDDAPEPRWSAALALGFVLAALGAALVIRRGVSPVGRFQGKAAAWGLALACLGTVLWVLAAWQA